MSVSFSKTQHNAIREEILPYNPSSTCPHSDRAWIWAAAEENYADVCLGCHEITAVMWDPRSPEPAAEEASDQEASPARPEWVPRDLPTFVLRDGRYETLDTK
jgi:hypothetical protein